MAREQTLAEFERDFEAFREQGRIWGDVRKERISRITFPRHSAELRARYLAIPDITAVVADILDGMGLRGVISATHIKPVLAGKRIAGTAVTQRFIPSRKATARSYVDKEPHQMAAYDAYFLSEPGDVLVADFGGNLDASNGGGNAALVAKTRGFSGSIVWGAVRDLDSVHEFDYPVWSAGVTPMSGKYRAETIEINGPVTVHDVAVFPGDLALADDSGVAFVPAELVERVIETAEAAEARGNRFRALLLADTPLKELREKFAAAYRK
jgi:regulator of RNase E activity RraA